MKKIKRLLGAIIFPFLFAAPALAASVDDYSVSPDNPVSNNATLNISATISGIEDVETETDVFTPVQSVGILLHETSGTGDFFISGCSPVVGGASSITATFSAKTLIAGESATDYFESFVGGYSSIDCTGGGAWSDNFIGRYNFGSSIYISPVSGCTDPTATNYDSNADYSNGMCEYPGDGSDDSSFSGMIAAASSGMGSTTGFDIQSVINWSGDNLIKLFVGSALAVIYALRYWLAALAIIGGIIFFAYKALKHGNKLTG